MSIRRGVYSIWHSPVAAYATGLPLVFSVAAEESILSESSLSEVTSRGLEARASTMVAVEACVAVFPTVVATVLDGYSSHPF
jgi:hypothetical protein